MDKNNLTKAFLLTLSSHFYDVNQEYVVKITSSDIAIYPSFLQAKKIKHRYDICDIINHVCKIHFPNELWAGNKINISNLKEGEYKYMYSFQNKKRKWYNVACI